MHSPMSISFGSIGYHFNDFRISFNSFFIKALRLLQCDNVPFFHPECSFSISEVHFNND